MGEKQNEMIIRSEFVIKPGVYRDWDMGRSNHIYNFGYQSIEPNNLIVTWIICGTELISYKGTRTDRQYIRYCYGISEHVFIRLLSRGSWT